MKKFSTSGMSSAGAIRTKNYPNVENPHNASS